MGRLTFIYYFFGGGGGVCLFLFIVSLLGCSFVSFCYREWVYSRTTKTNRLTAYQYLDVLFNVQTGNLVFLWVSNQIRLSDKACKVISIEREMCDGQCTSYGD